MSGSGHRGTPRRYVGTPPRPAEAAILALQRTAGNRAVTSVLVQRVNGKRKAPAATTFTSASQDFTYATGTAPAEVRWAGARPVTVTGAVVPTEPIRPPTAVPLAYLQKDQGGTASERRLLGFDGGHVIGLHLGGPNVGDNVVPMYPAFNRGVWKNMEDATKRDATFRRVPYRMTVTLGYTGAAEVPSTLTVVREYRDATSGAWLPAFPQTTLSQPDDIPVTARLSTVEERVVNPQPGDVLDQVTRDDPADLFDTGGLSLKNYLNAKGSMPPSKKAMYPDDPAKRPYGLLDLLTFNGRLNLRMETAGAGSDFTATQRTVIIQTNMARNAGRIKSDDPADPHQYLDERGSANAPEVDHIVPKSLGGSNFYSNARVISWQLNNKEARIKPLRGLVDIGRLALPTLPRTAPEKAEVIVEQYLARFSGRDFAVAQVTGWGDQQFSPQSTRVKSLVTTVLQTMAARGQLVESSGRYRRP